MTETSDGTPQEEPRSGGVYGRNPDAENQNSDLPLRDIPFNPIFRPGLTGNAAVSAAVPWLAGAHVPAPARDARILLAEAHGITLAKLPTLILDTLSPQVTKQFDRLVKRRMRREPMSHILGYRHFMNRTFRVNSDVLDPRPETEILIQVAKSEPYTRVLDLGTGSGAILCTLLADARGKATGVGVDTSEEICQVAFYNTQSTGVTEAADIFISDWFEWVEGQYDLIVTNPPYIAADEIPHLQPEVRDWEPRFALTDGGDGLGAYRRIAKDLPTYLAPGGRFVCEIGPTQAAQVAEILKGAGLIDMAVHQDYDDRDRVVSARMPA